MHLKEEKRDGISRPCLASPLKLESMADPNPDLHLLQASQVLGTLVHTRNNCTYNQIDPTEIDKNICVLSTTRIITALIRASTFGVSKRDMGQRVGGSLGSVLGRMDQLKEWCTAHQCFRRTESGT